MFKYVKQHSFGDLSQYIGLVGEIISSDDGDLFLHDGVTAGGIALPKTVTVTLNKSQLNALSLSPVLIIPAPGENKMIVVLYAIFSYHHDSFDMFPNDPVYLYYGTDSSGVPAVTARFDAALNAFIDAISPASMLGTNGTVPQVIEPSFCANLPIVLSSASDPTGGGSNANVVLTVTYQIIPV